MDLDLLESRDAYKNLPVSLQGALKGYVISKSNDDLDDVLYAVLLDLGAEIERDAIRDETDFMQDLGLESLVLAEFVFFFEDVFDVKITNEELSSMHSLGELKAFISQKLV
jgi:acyl carrier protein